MATRQQYTSWHQRAQLTGTLCGCLLQDLLAMADSFQAKRKAGTVQAHGSGYGGSGFKFDAIEEDQVKADRKVRLGLHPDVHT